MSARVDFPSCFWPCVAALALAMLSLMAGSIVQESQTSDEAAHLVAGYSYWVTGDYRLNPEHPPLAKLLCAVPLLALRPALPLDSPGWRQAHAFHLGREFLYSNRLSPEALLLAGRSVTIALTLALLVLTAWAARRWFGAPAGLLAAALLALDPTVLAHGRYVTTDLAITLFFFAASVAWGRYLESGRGLPLAGILAGLALGSKHSGLLLLVVLVALGAVSWRLGVAPQRRVLGGLAVVVPVALLVLAALYGGSLRTYADGLRAVWDHNRQGHPAFLFGRYSGRGWWYYFPAAFALKTPLGTLALVVLAMGTWLGAAAHRGRTPSWPVWLVLLPAGVYGSACLASRINIGLRHLLPVYPFLFVLLAAQLARTLRLRSRVIAPGTIACLLLLAVETGAAYPHFLPYFHAACGGPSRGPQYLLDSNIDWGQDWLRLAAFARQRGLQPLVVLDEGFRDAQHFGFVAADLPQPGQMVAVGIHRLYADPRLASLRAMVPRYRVGYSTLVFHVPSN